MDMASCHPAVNYCSVMFTGANYLHSFPPCWSEKCRNASVMTSSGKLTSSLNKVIVINFGCEPNTCHIHLPNLWQLIWL